MARHSRFLVVVAALVVAGGAIAVFSDRLVAQNSGGGGDSNRDIIAVTGTYGSSASVLYVIDTKTRHLAVYKTDNGRKIELVAARDIALDLKLESYNDQSEGGYTPRELRKGWADIGRTGGTTSRPEPEPAPR